MDFIVVLDIFCSIAVFNSSVDDCKKNSSIVRDNFKADSCQPLTVLLGGN